MKADSESDVPGKGQLRQVRGINIPPAMKMHLLRIRGWGFHRFCLI